MIQTALKTVSIDHVVLYTRDLPRARRFYLDVLGMEVAHENDHQCFMRCGAQQVALFTADTEIHGGSEVNHMALRLQSGTYEEVKSRLEAEGIAVHGRPGDPNCIYFDDPDGHGLQLALPREGRAPR